MSPDRRGCLFRSRSVDVVGVCSRESPQGLCASRLHADWPSSRVERPAGAFLARDSAPAPAPPFGLNQKEAKVQAPNALAPWLCQGVPGSGTKTRTGQKLPAFALLTSVRQSDRA